MADVNVMNIISMPIESSFLGGMLIGAAMALPVGPGAFSVINQGIRKPLRVVFKTALMCVTVDLLWNIFLSTCGDVSLTMVHILLSHKEIIRTWAGPIFIFIGLYVIRSMFLAKDASSGGIKQTFFVSLFNPLIPVTLATMLVYVVGADYFIRDNHTHFSVVSGVVVGELITWTFGILLFHILILKGLPEIAIPMFFSALFIASGICLTFHLM